MKELHRNIRIVGRLAVSDISFRTIPIPENANGTYMQSIDDISIEKTARAHQIAARVFFSAFFLV